MRPAAAPTLMLFAATLAACESHEFEPPSRAAQVAEADSMFDPAMFDTIAWNGDSVRLAAGNDLFAARCRRCHGYLGRGGPAEVRGEQIDVPSLVEPDWPHAGDLDAIRRRIFVGHPQGMPTWGVAGLSLREIDAVAYYIDALLRPEALQQSAPDGA